MLPGYAPYSIRLATLTGVHLSCDFSESTTFHKVVPDLPRFKEPSLYLMSPFLPFNVLLGEADDPLRRINAKSRKSRV
jgi:hypothetical protein